MMRDSLVADDNKCEALVWQRQEAVLKQDFDRYALILTHMPSDGAEPMKPRPSISPYGTTPHTIYPISPST